MLCLGWGSYQSRLIIRLIRGCLYFFYDYIKKRMFFMSRAWNFELTCRILQIYCINSFGQDVLN